MVAEGAFRQVRETRTMFQDWMAPQFIEIVEQATGRKVRAFFSQVSQTPDIALELFLLHPDRAKRRLRSMIQTTSACVFSRRPC